SLRHAVQQAGSSPRRAGGRPGARAEPAPGALFRGRRVSGHRRVRHAEGGLQARPEDARVAGVRGLAVLLATGLGVGRLPIAPATWASAFTAIPLFFLLPRLTRPEYLALTIGITILAI